MNSIDFLKLHLPKKFQEDIKLHILQRYFEKNFFYRIRFFLLNIFPPTVSHLLPSFRHDTQTRSRLMLDYIVDTYIYKNY